LRVLFFTIELRVLLVLVLFILCLPFVPAVRSWEATVVGALTAALTSAFDYWCWHFGLIKLSGPLFGIALGFPAISFGIAALLVRYIDRRSSPRGAL
jgi:nicotinamide riboside transporter PnuC